MWNDFLRASGWVYPFFLTFPQVLSNWLKTRGGTWLNFQVIRFFRIQELRDIWETLADSASEKIIGKMFPTTWLNLAVSIPFPNFSLFFSWTRGIKRTYRLAPVARHSCWRVLTTSKGWNRIVEQHPEAAPAKKAPASEAWHSETNNQQFFAVFMIFQVWNSYVSFSVW